jgi:hypothetical protein
MNRTEATAAWLKLGDRQKSCLQALRHHGHWHTTCGWKWDTKSNTRRILDTLVKRGLATIDEQGVYRPVVPS